MSPYRLSLITRLWLCHLTLLAAVALAWAWGWLDGMIATDTLYLVRVNCCLFLYGAVIAQVRAHWLSRELDGAPGSKVARYLALGRPNQPAFEAMRSSIASRVNAVSFIASQIMLFGLAGTIVGFIVATSGVTVEAATDVSAVGPMAALMISGVGLSLYKTLVGIALGGGYLMLLHRMLAVAATHAVSRAAQPER